MMRLRATLRLQLLRHDWTGIADTVPPSFVNSAEQAAAIETISFIRRSPRLIVPTATVKRRSRRSQTFIAVVQTWPPTPSICLRCASVACSEGDLFGQLHGPALVRGRQVLVEAEQMMLLVRGVTKSDEEIFDCNKALLLLAIGHPKQANELLASLN